MRLSQIARKLGISTENIIEFLQAQGVEIKKNPNVKLTSEQVALIEKHHPKAKSIASKPTTPQLKNPLPSKIATVQPIAKKAAESPRVKELVFEKPKLTQLRKIDFSQKAPRLTTIPTPTPKPIRRRSQTPTPLPKAFNDLPQKPSLTVVKQLEWKKPAHATPTQGRKRIISSFSKNSPQHTPQKALHFKTNYRRKPASRRTYQKKRRFKKSIQEEVNKMLKVTNFIRVTELALLLKVPINEIIDTCKDLSIEITANQHLNGEVVALIAEAFDKQLEIIEEEHPIEKEVAENLVPRTPVVVVMGHVDHGKTSLLDYIRKSKVTAGEAGGITQHIGAYQVKNKQGDTITFLDTPGHKAFTAMRARGAQVTDIAIIVIAADDGLMPQTKEAINHAKLAGIPMIFALNKIDRPEANPDRVKEQLAQMNITVEEWGGNYQHENISAKTGEGIDKLLEKITLEAEMLELKANPKKRVTGVVLEATLQKGRGYVINTIIQEGTLKKGDVALAGAFYGKVKNIYNQEGKVIKEAGPSTPVQILGFNGAPEAGQAFKVVNSEQEGRSLAKNHEKVLQDQTFRAHKKDSLERFNHAISRTNKEQIAIVLKGDTQGSIEALADMLTSLSTDEVDVVIIHKGVGPVFESDALLSVTAQARIIAFQTSIDPKARKVIQKEKIALHACKIIYEVVDYIQGIIEKQNAPDKEVVVIGKAEVTKIFNITGTGTIAGCVVREGTIKRNSDIRLIRSGETIYEGSMKQLKREKQIIKEAQNGTECGINIHNFNDILVGDIVESIEVKEA